MSSEPSSKAGRRRASGWVRKPILGPVLRFELRLKALCMAARLLPALTADNASAERVRLVDGLRRGEPLEPRFVLRRRRVPREAYRLIDELRREAVDLPGGALYCAKLDELELDLMLLDSLGNPRLVRPLSARRYGTPDALAPTAVGPLPLRACARRILDRVAPAPEPRVVPAEGGSDSLAGMVRTLADGAGLDVAIRLEPRLAAGAATGERTVFIADRCFGAVEAKRLAVHEVLGHLVAAANGRAQSLRLLEWGTAGSFVDQEGVALYLEEAHGVMDAGRLRALAGRVVASELLHAGASFAQAARRLHRDEGFCAVEAVNIAERAYRGGGVARDHAYLHGWLRVHHALRTGAATVDELRGGRLDLDALPTVRDLVQQGYARPPLFRPNLARSFLSTESGTTPRRSPPRDAASLIRLELTKK